MTITLSEEQQKVLAETSSVATPDEFNRLMREAEGEMNLVVREVMEPNQPIDETKIELRDLYLGAGEHAEKLAQRRYGAERLAAFRNAIRLLDTAFVWFGEGKRTGMYRTRTVEEVVQASRGWRARVAAIAGQAFVFEPDIAEQFEDVNTTRTITEEKSDLGTLNALVAQHEARLTEFGLTPQLIAQGKALLDEAEGRDLAGILGLRNQDEAIALRNRVLTYAVALGKEARAAGINACFDDEKVRRRFERASFRNALRKLRGGRRAKAEESKGTPPMSDPTPGGD